MQRLGQIRQTVRGIRKYRFEHLPCGLERERPQIEFCQLSHRNACLCHQAVGQGLGFAGLLAPGNDQKKPGDWLVDQDRQEGAGGFISPLDIVEKQHHRADRRCRDR